MSLRLTRSGWLVLALAAALAVLGRQLHYPELVAGAGVLVAAIVTGVVWVAVVNRPAVVHRSLDVSRVTEHEPATTTVAVTNPRSRRRPPGQVVDTVAGTTVALGLPRVPAGGTVAVPVATAPLRRGRYRLGPAELVAVDPLGLARSRRRSDATATLLVHPRVIEARARTDVRGRRTGLRLPAPSTDSIELHRLDEYVTGDDPRLIHWATTLRRGRLMVRHPARDRHGETLVLLDTSAAAYASADEFDHAVRTAASVVVALAPESDLTRFATTGSRTRTIDASGRRRVELLDTLAAVEPGPDDPGLANYRLRGGRRWTTLVAVTGSAAEGDRADAARLARHVEGFTLLRLGDAVNGPLTRQSPGRGVGRSGPAARPAGLSISVLAAPTSEELVHQWNSSPAR